MVKKNILMTVVFILSISGLYAQGFELGLQLEGGFPQGDFKNNVEQDGIGVGGIFGYSFPNTPFVAGVDLGFINYGSVSRRENFSPNIPEVQVNVRTTNNIFTGHLFLRAEVKNRIVRPYIDGLLGLNYLFTESRIVNNNFEEEEIASTTNFDDTATSYGMGGGIKFKIAQNKDWDSKETYRWYLDFKIRYLMGGNAEYLREGSLRNVDGRLLYDTRFSKTDLLTAGVGFIVNIY